jgi:hypothetical protein
MYTTMSLTIFCNIYSVASPTHLTCLRLEKYIRVVASCLIYKRLSFYIVEDLLYYSCIIELILSVRYIKTCYLSAKSLLIYRKSFNCPVAAVASTFTQDRHAGRYVGSKRVTIFVGSSPTCRTAFRSFDLNNYVIFCMVPHFKAHTRAEYL